jgi:hypothetical protein
MFAEEVSFAGVGVLGRLDVVHRQLCRLLNYVYNTNQVNSSVHIKHLENNLEECLSSSIKIQTVK